MAGWEGDEAWCGWSERKSWIVGAGESCWRGRCVVYWVFHERVFYFNAKTGVLVISFWMNITEVYRNSEEIVVLLQSVHKVSMG